MACILLVDDETDMLLVRALLLRIEGYTVITARNGEEAFDLALKNSVDLVLTDWMMPIMNGIELCHKLRSNEGTQKTPIILSSGVDIVVKENNTPYDAFLPKLASIDEQLLLIRQLLDR